MLTAHRIHTALQYIQVPSKKLDVFLGRHPWPVQNVMDPRPAGYPAARLEELLSEYFTQVAPLLSLHELAMVNPEALPLDTIIQEMKDILIGGISEFVADKEMVRVFIARHMAHNSFVLELLPSAQAEARLLMLLDCYTAVMPPVDVDVTSFFYPFKVVNFAPGLTLLQV